MTIVLIGLPGSGKSTVGAELAVRLGVDLLDSDQLVEKTAGRSIAEMFAGDGEAYFRQLETQVILENLDNVDLLALGGGAVMTPAIAAALAGHQVIWLDAPWAALVERLAADSSRPLLATDLAATLEQLAAQRRSTYHRLADLQIPADQTVTAVVDRIIAWLGESKPLSTRVIEVRSDRPYAVTIGPGGLAQLAAMLGDASRVAIIHPPVMAAIAGDLAAILPEPKLLPVPVGEPAKTVTVLAGLWTELARSGFTRNDLIIGLGGGSTTDLAGFTAASWLRGIAYISVPTTVLAMADAAVGGKTGINLEQGKNLVGAFWEPRGVICDTALLASLPRPEVVSGLAEVVKCGFIADPAILDLAAAPALRHGHCQDPVFIDALTRAIVVKASVVATDLREQSPGGAIGREALNYGHTLAHAIESLTDYHWSHGQAVSVGMVFAAEVARAIGWLTKDEVDLHRQLLTGVGLPTRFDQATWPALRQVMSLDKKARGHRLRLVLLNGLGQPRIASGLDEVLLERAFERISC
ncbi:MAG: 3-dehydroquinate synthase [Propionibacteriaceae bacterium]|nr:3-dehydroquinate synthase [Propionibacteriaceae bacterium]